MLETKKAKVKILIKNLFLRNQKTKNITTETKIRKKRNSRDKKNKMVKKNEKN